MLIEKTLLMLEEMKILIEYLNMPIYEMLTSISGKEYLGQLNFIAICADEISKGVDFPKAWKYSLSLSCLQYKTQEKEKLLQLGENLGASNKENQVNILSLHSAYFCEYLQKAKDKRKKYGSMASIIGVLSGCMIFILII